MSARYNRHDLEAAALLIDRLTRRGTTPKVRAATEALVALLPELCEEPVDEPRLGRTREQHLRRFAERRGLVLTKSRRRQRPTDRPYSLIRRGDDEILTGLTLDEVDAFLRGGGRG